MKNFLINCLKFLWKIIKPILKFIRDIFVLSMLCCAYPEKHDSEKLIKIVEDDK